VAENNPIVELYELSAKYCKDHAKYTVKPKNIRKLSAAKESRRPAAGEYTGSKEIEELTHPPCVTDALIHGIVDERNANRNKVTMFLAGYLKTIDRGLEESINFLTAHALNTLAKFSHSSSRDIELSTLTSVRTIFLQDKYSHNCSFARKLGYDCNPSCEIYAEYKKLEYGKKTIDLPESEPETPHELIFDSPAELRTHMVSKINDYVSDLREKNRKRQIKPLLVKAPAGSGKTITTFNWVSNSGLRALWIGSQLDLFENIPSEHRPKWHKIRGRQGDVRRNGILTPGNCVKPDTAAFLREKNLNVHKHLCEVCDSFKSCEYYHQFEDKDRHWFVQQPMFLFKVKKLIKEFDVIIFDEDIMGQFKQEIKIKRSDFLDIRKWVDESYLDLVSVDAPLRVIKPVLSLRVLIDTFIHLLSDKDLGYPLAGKTLQVHLQLHYARVLALIRFTEEPFHFALPDDFPSLFDAIDTPRKDFLNNVFIDLEAPQHPVPYNFTKDLINILEPEIMRGSHESHLSRFTLEKLGKEPIISLNFKHDPPPKSKPTIILDATAKPIIYESLFNIKTIEYEPRLRFENEVSQIYSTAGGISSLKSNPLHRKRMLEVLKRLTEKEPDTLIICKQNMKKHIQKLGVVPDKMITHFYGNRGSNEFESARQVIIFGSPGYPENLIRKIAAAFFYTQDLVSTTEMRIKRYHGTNKGIKVLTYTDPRLQAILEISREDEVYQSLSRIRPVLDKSKRIVLISNIVIPGLPVTKLLSVNDIVGHSFTKKNDLHERLRASFGNLIESRGICVPSKEIHSEFPDTHRTTLDRVLKKVAQEFGLKCYRCHIKNEIHGNRISVYSKSEMEPGEMVSRLKLLISDEYNIEDIVEISAHT